MLAMIMVLIMVGVFGTVGLMIVSTKRAESARGPQRALILTCKLTTSPQLAGRLGTANGITISRDEVALTVDDRKEWTFSNKKEDILGKDSLVMREGGGEIAGSIMRAGSPHAFTYNTENGLLVWTMAFDDRPYAMRFKCA